MTVNRKLEPDTSTLVPLPSGTLMDTYIILAIASVHSAYRQSSYCLTIQLVVTGEIDRYTYMQSFTKRNHTHAVCVCVRHQCSLVDAR